MRGIQDLERQLQDEDTGFVQKQRELQKTKSGIQRTRTSLERQE